MITKFTHNSTTADTEPDWGNVDKTALPRAAHADQGEADKKTTWKYPHHWVKDGGDKNDAGVYTTGTMYLHKGGLNAAWAAAQGARTGQEASPAVQAHLQAHRKAIGLDDKNERQELIHRAYSIFEIKSFNDETREIEGIATTPAVDRVGDVVMPEGIKFKLPLPFIYQHNSRQPLGQVIRAQVTKEGLWIRAKIAAAGVADFIDEAWNLIKAKLVRGLSIGFRSLKEAWVKERYGYDFLETELLEVSAVTIAANQEATITAIKSADARQAALSHRPATVSLNKTISGAAENLKGKSMKTIQETIADFENKRAALMARSDELVKKSQEEGRSFEPEESQEFDNIKAEVKTIDEHLERLRVHERDMLAAAKPITPDTGKDTDAAAGASGQEFKTVNPNPVITVKQPELPKGTAYTRFAIALMLSKGNLMQAEQVALNSEAWKNTPEVAQVLKAAVAAGTTTGTGWAAELVQYQVMAEEFIEYLRPKTVIGRIPNLRRVPFKVKIQKQTAGSTAAWVGEGARKPVGKLTFDTITLDIAKAAGIVPLSQELVRFSNPSAEAIIREDMADNIVQFLDEQFLDSTVGATASNPAAITNGASNQAASGTNAASLRADFKAAINAMQAVNIDVSGLVICMRPALALSISLMLNAMGAREFPGIKAEGGTFEGYLVVTSNSVPSGDMDYLQPKEILLADEGGIELDASKEASIVMDDGGSPNVTEMVSFWQNNLVGLKCERTINWARRRDEAVYRVHTCAYA